MIEPDSFSRCLQQPELSLARAALLFARNDYPELAVEAYLAELDTIAATIQAQLYDPDDIVTTLQQINQHLFGDLGFCGCIEDYYDPRNSYLNEVLDRRRGIPITLSVIYLEIAWRLNLPLEGVGFPGHFLVKLPLEGGLVVLDPFYGGISLSAGDLDKRLQLVLDTEAQQRRPALENLLAGASKREILARMLRNLRTIHQQQEDWQRALTISNRILLVLPDSAADFRDRAAILDKLECPRAALLDYQRYLETAPEAADWRHISQKIARLEQNLPRLN